MTTAAPRLEVSSLPLNPSVRNKLLCAGFRTTGDFEGIGPVDLATEAQLTHEEALLVLKLGLPTGLQAGLDGALSAKQILEQEAAAKRIFTFCNELDNILGGGVATGQITEFCGEPGVGKTQIGMQLAIDVQLPEAFGGAEGEAVYIDTEGSFMLERCVQMAEAFLTHITRRVASKADPRQQAAVAGMSVEGMLSRIHYFRVRDHIEQLAAVQLLPGFLREHPKVRLVVMDSVTFHWRADWSDMAQRTRLLAQMAQELMQIAGRQQVAVVLMNQVTTKTVAGSEHTRLVPALGDSWAHAATSRVILYWQGQTRRAFIYKSPSQPANGAEYHVTEDGVRNAAKRGGAKRPRPAAAGE